MNIFIVTILIVAIIVQTVNPMPSIYADKCDQDADAQCDAKNTSNTDPENCLMKDFENKNGDSENSDANVQNSNVQTSNAKCSDKDSHTNPHLLGEGPYSFPTDLLELPI